MSKDMKYSKDHVWALKEDNYFKLGLSSIGKEQIGEIVFIEFPKTGQILKKDDVLCIIESSKSASDILSPLSGEVVAINEQLQKDIDLINTSSEEKNWICIIEPSDLSQFDLMLSKDDYEKLRDDN